MVETKYDSPKQRRTSLRRFSPRKDDSPSRQLGFELEKALEQLHLHDFERRKVHAYNRRSYHEELDAKDLAMAKAHMEALEAASAKHEAVRQEAEAVLQKHLKEQEERRQREAEEERQRQEREAREKAERERKAKEEAERKIRLEKERKDAEARKVAEEKARAEAAEAERRNREASAQKEKEEQARAEKERAESEAAAKIAKAQAEKEAAEKQRAQQALAKTVTASIPSQPGFYAASPEAEGQHNEYLSLHQKLKTFRKDFWEQAKQNKPLKAAIGDMRRAMRTSVGQLTDDKVGNKKASERVKTAILQALKEVPSPEVCVSDYLPAHLSLNDQGSTKVPSLVIYLLSIFSKAVINAFTGECAVNTKAAEPIGTLAAQVFSLPDLQFQRSNSSAHPNASLIPILLAKYHRVAPILFGISGPESTAQGRIRLGWRTEPQPDSDKKTFVMEQRQHERMTGLGAGFSSLALRNFSKARLRNPFPPTHFWAALAGIVNTPPGSVQTSHLLLLKSMLENNAPERFVLFYGNIAIAAMREALVEFPKKLPDAMRTTPACRSLTLMVDAMEKEKYFRLT